MPLTKQEWLNLEKKANDLRNLTLDTTYWAGSAHIGGGLSVLDIMTVLYHKYMNIKVDDPNWADRDRFILSKGHAGVSYAATLCDYGFNDVEMLKTIAEVLELDIMDFYKDVDTKEINHSEKYDLSIISKYRTIMIINVVSLIVLLLIHILVIIYIGKLTTSLKTDHIIYHENIKDILLEINKTNLIEFICMSIALLGSVSCVIGTNIWFKAKYTDKLYQDVYIEVKHKYQLIYYILFAFLFAIILVGYFI